MSLPRSAGQSSPSQKDMTPEDRQESGASQSIPIVSFVGHSGSGKTTLLEKLIRELKRRGYRLAVIKHHHERRIQLDRPGKDSWRFARAGADQVILAGPDSAAHLRTFSQEPTLTEIVSGIRDVDLILTEGYKHAAAPKIEVRRAEAESRPVSDFNDLVAIVSDQPLGLDVRQLALDDPERLADFIEAQFLEPT